mmetsp:Transcript_26185/g.65481  ORF Transcript_26185/g.65481 Transcript_26185/m.65481 type:complete len:391 (-) Transcript_26185:136-1308(-)
MAEMGSLEDTQIPSVQPSEPATQWGELSAGEIYDVLGKKGMKLGHTANNMIKKLTQENYLPSDAPDLMEKTKKAKADQRKLFENLDDIGLGFLREELSKLTINTPSGSTGGDEAITRSALNDVCDNMKARVLHLIYDPESYAILTSCFAGPPKNDQRAVLDDKTTRMRGWQQLTVKYYNNEKWRPANAITDTRVVHLDPSKPPAEPYPPEKLRALHSTIRTKLTIYLANYHASGNNEDGFGNGTDQFYTDFVGSSALYLYAFLLIGDRPPSFCTRDLTQPSDVGIDEAVQVAEAKADSSIELLASRSALGKRTRALDEVGLRRVLVSMSDTERDRELSMTSFFRVSTTTSTLETLRKAIEGPSFALLDSGTQIELRSEYAALLKQIAHGK